MFHSYSIATYVYLLLLAMHLFTKNCPPNEGYATNADGIYLLDAI